MSNSYSVYVLTLHAPVDQTGKSLLEVLCKRSLCELTVLVPPQHQ